MKRFDIEVENGRAYLVGSPDGKYVSYSDAVEANYAVKQAQQVDQVAWQPGKRPPSVFKTSEAGRQYVADFFANALRRHDFSSYIKGHLAADFACALSDGLHAMHTAQPPAVADRDAIRRVFMAHGFTIKEGQTDLKPYVYEAAEALLRELSPAVAVTVPEGWIASVHAACIALEAAFSHAPAGTGDASCRANLTPTLSALRDTHRAMLAASQKP